MQANTLVFMTSDQPESCYRLRLPLDSQRREFLPDELLRGRLAHVLVDQHLTSRSILHETGSHVNRVTDCTIGTANYATTGTRTRESLADADLHVCDEIHLQIA